jgi:DNA-binding transcriptional LysR family regulator
MLDYSREYQVLATHLNFTSAARELGISQPGLSRHMGELERELGFKLLERDPVRLTAAGTRYLEGISQEISRIDSLIAECREISSRDGGRLTISMIAANDCPTLMVYNTLAAMRDEFENFEYGFDDSRKLTIEQSVLEGRADVGVVYFSPFDDQPGMNGSYAKAGVRDSEGSCCSDNDCEGGNDLEYDFMLHEPFLVMMHESNPLAQRRISFSDLSSCTVLLSANRKFQTWVDGMRRACDVFGCHPKFKMKDVDSVNDFLVSLQGNETVFISTSLRHSIVHGFSHLREADIENASRLTYPVYLVHAKNSSNPMVKPFIDLFRQAARKHDAMPHD